MKRLELTINGRVQGVGFRPFLYQLSRKYNLTGFVLNTPGGVSLQVQGIRHNLIRFLRKVRTTSPSQAKVEQIAVKSLPVVNDETDFLIVASQKDGAVSAVLPPDLATCESCLQEIFDPKNRRHRYPFTNCTDCGPRFTIVQGLPYDRHMTTMAGFNMCEVCGREYHSPSDRRFHAQPNACPRCGPSLMLSIPDPATGKLRRELLAEPLTATVSALKAGRIAAIKGLGGYHLAAAATNLPAVERIRRIKGREGKPLAIMCRDLEQVKMVCEVIPAETALLTASARPIVILRKLDSPQIHLAEAIAPGQDSVGVMLPYTPLHHLIMEAIGQPLVMTSANQGDQPIAITEEELAPELLREVAVVLGHNRPIAARCDDSVVIAAPEQIFLRRSRGYVPESLAILPFRQALGIGADFKNTACFIRDREAYFTQHIGNLDDVPAQTAARQGIEHLSRLFDLHPEVVGCDLHPEYRSRQFAATLDLPVVTVQHHHAHILSCMAEHRLAGPVLGVAFDGTGFGTDGTIWGGEFLVADYTGFTRVAALRPVGMPGGERVVREPWRMALSYLYEIFGSQIPDFPGLDRLYNCGGDLLLPLLGQRLNTPETTSAGRFFDGISAMTGLALYAAYEGEAAMALEGLARRNFLSAFEPYPFEVNGQSLLRLDWEGTVRSIISDLQVRRPSSEIAGRFHLTVAYGILEICLKLRGLTGLNQVALSGGVFQNALLLLKTRKLLEENAFQAYVHRQIPPNDGGIALGQAVFAAAALG